MLHFEKILKHKNIKIKSHNEIIDLNEIIKDINYKIDFIENPVLNIILIYIMSGCDYISFFYYITKQHFFNTFIEYNQYIFNVKNNSLIFFEDSKFKIIYNSCLKLIGICYYKKYTKYFDDDVLFMPGKHCVNYMYNILSKKFYNNKEKIIPDIISLNFHLLRCEYVINMWNQALKKNINYDNPELFGWIYENNHLRFRHK